MAAQAPDLCAGDDCEARHAQLSSAAAQLEQYQEINSCSAVRRLIQTIARRNGDDDTTPAVGAEELARALARWDQSLRTYRSVLLDATGSSADAHVALAAAYLERGKGPESLKYTRRPPAASNPDRSDSSILQGLAYDLEKRPGDAAKSLARAAQLGPKNPASTYGLAQRLIAIGDEAGAADALRRFDAAQVATRGDGITSTTAGRAVRASRSAAADGRQSCAVCSVGVCERVLPARRRRAQSGSRRVPGRRGAR